MCRQSQPTNASQLLNSEDAVSPSTARLVTGSLATASIDVLGPNAFPVEAMNTVRYFATSLDKPTSVRSTSRIQQEAVRNYSERNATIAVV